MEEYKSKDLDHLGIVAVMCEEIGLVQLIDTLIPPDPRSNLTTGECVKLMVINGLGFTSRPLYLESQFYASKPLKRLLGRTIDFEEISDDKLGRTLDRCYEANCNQIFGSIAGKAALLFNVDQKFHHLDTTSMHVHGEYEDEGIGLINHGHSKDNLPNLKQFMVSLICSQDGDVPLLAETIPGNTSDKTHFRETLGKLKNQIIDSDAPSYYIGDSALYTKDTIQEISNYFKWITRVPENITDAKKLIQKTSKDEMTDAGDGYFMTEFISKYGGIFQRWLLVYSEKAYKREGATLIRRISKEKKNKSSELNKMCSKTFSCEQDAQKSLKEFEKKLKFHRLTDLNISNKNKRGVPGRPKKEEKISVVYKITAKIAKDEAKIAEALTSKGKFIIATNEEDINLLTSSDILSNYKEQQSVERGFRFLKDPFFLTSSVFLKKEERIVALGMIMCLCLLVYTLTQRHLRLRLAEMNETVPNQKNKETKKPTVRWIYQVFEGVHLLIHRSNGKIRELVLNLNPVRRHVLQILGPPYEQIYADAA